LQSILTEVAEGGVVGVAVAEGEGEAEGAAEGDAEADSEPDGVAETELDGVGLRVPFGLVTFDGGVHAASPMTITPPTAIVSTTFRSRPAAEK
jgi:hypothetical protein